MLSSTELHPLQRISFPNKSQGNDVISCQARDNTLLYNILSKLNHYHWEISHDIIIMICVNTHATHVYTLCAHVWKCCVCMLWPHAGVCVERKWAHSTNTVYTCVVHINAVLDTTHVYNREEERNCYNMYLRLHTTCITQSQHCDHV